MRWDPLRAYAGAAVEHTASAFGHRGWKGQPVSEQDEAAQGGTVAVDGRQVVIDGKFVS